MQEGASAGGADVKTCPMCAEDIPIGSETCEYCGAGFGVVRTGYCPECHHVGAVTPEGACSRCGTAAVDVRVESRHLEAPPAAAPPPAAQAAPPAAPPPPPAAPPQQYAPVPLPAPVTQPQPQAYPPPPYQQPYQQQPYAQPYPQQPYGTPPMGQAGWTYQSGMGGLSVVPPVARGWNWGAFFLSWIWGIGNNTWIALLALIPYVNLVMVFVLGAKGSEWAWRNKRWESVEQFRRTQSTWAIVGLVLFAIGLVLGIIGAVAASLSSSTTTTGMTI